MKIPYIRVKQRGETFYITKLKADFLKEHVNFHFRDPYLKYQSPDVTEKVNEYLDKLKNKGLTLDSSTEGIQRRLQISRINDIRNYLETNENNFFPNSILLSVDVSKVENFEEQYLCYEEKETGYFDLPDNLKFTVIDGQHRLAGLFISDPNIIKEFELVSILLFNISLSTAAKLFADINGKQKPVNRSLIYDLYTEMNIFEIEEIKKVHGIAQKFYSDNKSPLFRQIKMLGIGKGAISQAFFIDYVLEAIKKTGITDIQEMYNQLFFYYSAFQRVFPDDWPVPIHYKDYADLDNFSNSVLTRKKSQLVKTNGFGAIMLLFPDVYRISKKTFESYFEIISKLKNKIQWVEDPTNPQGTGKKFQNFLLNKMRELLEI
jgi:DGQHR domain-containing protein